MLRLKTLLPAGSDLEDVLRVLQEEPEVAEGFEKIAASSSQKNRTRIVLDNLYGPEVRDFLLPLTQRGPRVRKDKDAWNLISGRVLLKIAAALDTELPLSKEAADWTPEMASTAADAVVAHYPNINSTVKTLTSLRKALGTFGVAPEVVRATFRPDLTILANEAQAKRRDEHINDGIDIPPPFERIADLKDRVEAFVAAPVTQAPTGQDAADFLVVFSARTGETETLDLGPGGGIVGALKKRGKNVEFPFASAVGRDLAERFLVAWKAKAKGHKTRAVNELGPLVRSWGQQRRDLRTIGAKLAVRAGEIAGDVDNAGQARAVQRAALRHGQPGVAEVNVPAVDHYQRVRDPDAQMFARFAELPDRDKQAVRDLFDRLRAPQVQLLP